MTLKIALIREGKTPPDKRVALTPEQARRVNERWPNVKVVAETSAVRKFTDDEYRAAGVEVVNDVSDCDILIGVKEVPVQQLVADKTYLFFSHTFKLQPYNAKLLAAIVEKRIRLIDYEIIKATTGKRLIGFGRYAGVVGCYNGWRLFGLRHGLYTLKPAHECHDRVEMEAELRKVHLPENTRVVLTGFGRVGNGAREIMAQVPLREVTPEHFLAHPTEGGVFTHLEVQHYNRRKSDGGFDKAEFYSNPKGYESTFPRYAHAADMYIACHYFGDGSPFLYTREDARHPDWRVKVVADVSCDVDGPVASTLRASTIADPFYGYDPVAEAEVAFDAPGAISVMAIDNLPCELPYNASEDFGEELIKHVLPLLIEGDRDGILQGATQTLAGGGLAPKFAYLADYVAKGRKELQEKGVL